MRTRPLVLIELAEQAGMELPKSSSSSPPEEERQHERKRVLRALELTQVFPTRLGSDEGKLARAYLSEVRKIDAEAIDIRPRLRRHTRTGKTFSVTRQGWSSARATTAARSGPEASGNDRADIERLCRYGARGPLTLRRLTRASNDIYVHDMKRTVRGEDELILTGTELSRKLAVLVPPPRVHLVRFCGLFVRCTAREGERPKVAAFPAGARETTGRSPRLGRV